MKKWMITSVVLVGLLAGCGSKEAPKESTESSTTNSTTVETSSSSSVTEESTNTSVSTSGEDGEFSVGNASYSVEIPARWANYEDVAGLNPDASYALEKDDLSAYYMVIAENKVDFSDFNTYVDLVTGSLEEEATDVKEEDVTVNGMKGVRKTFDLNVQGVNLSYIFDVVESETQFVQSVGWSLKSEAEVAKPEIESVLNSLQQK